MLTERQRDQRWVEEQRWVNEVRAAVGDRAAKFHREHGRALFADLNELGMMVTEVDIDGNLRRIPPVEWEERHLGGHFHVGETPPQPTGVPIKTRSV